MKKLAVFLFLFIFIGTIEMNAQVVDKKPKEPGKKLLKTDVEKPTTKVIWVWVPGEWDWKKKSKEYKWVKGHWAKAPKGKKYWQKGHWKKVKKGWEWSPGYWK